MIIGKRKVEKLRKQGENVRVYLSGIKQAFSVLIGQQLMQEFPDLRISQVKTNMILKNRNIVNMLHK